MVEINGLRSSFWGLELRHPRKIASHVLIRRSLRMVRVIPGFHHRYPTKISSAMSHFFTHRYDHRYDAMGAAESNIALPGLALHTPARFS